MRFGVLGTGFWAKEVHAASLAAHPTAELVGVWGRDLAKAKAVGAEFDVAGLRRPRRAAGRGRRRRDRRCRPTCRSPLAERAAAAGKHLLLEKPIALDVAGADRLVDRGARRRRRLGRVLHLPVPARDVDLAGAGGPDDAGRRARLVAGLLGRTSPFDASPWRNEHGALWDIGPHALSLLVPALGPVVSVQAGAGLRRHRPPGAAPTSPAPPRTVHALAHRRAAVGRHRVLRARRRRPAGAAAGDPQPAGRLRGGGRRTDGRRGRPAARTRATSASGGTSSPCWRPRHAPWTRGCRETPSDRGSQRPSAADISAPQLVELVLAPAARGDEPGVVVHRDDRLQVGLELRLGPAGPHDHPDAVAEQPHRVDRRVLQREVGERHRRGRAAASAAAARSRAIASEISDRSSTRTDSCPVTNSPCSAASSSSRSSSVRPVGLQLGRQQRHGQRRGDAVLVPGDGRRHRVARAPPRSRTPAAPRPSRPG